MTLLKLRSAPIVLIEDDGNRNIIPLLSELTQHEKNTINMFCYEQPISNWRTVFREKSNVIFHEEFKPESYEKYTSTKGSVIIDSVNQMSLCLNWNASLKYIRKLNNDSNVLQVILILHKDCLSHFSKLQAHLNHVSNAIVSYDPKESNKVRVQLKKSGKIVKTEEILSYDIQTSTLKSAPITKEEKKEDEPEKPLPSNLSTFKIEIDQTDKLEKYKLQLPYMSKINEGVSKVYYEPDAVDDWDEEDPDEDLDI